MAASLLAMMAALPLSMAVVAPDGVGRLPALGWNSWNAFNCDIDESHFLDAAKKMKEYGLLEAGYNHVNIDDCWSVKEGRDKETGRLLPDPKKFPRGIKGTADAVHEMGFKLGIYSSAGTVTCAKYPASLGNEVIDAESFADWGVDYLKYDNCGVPANLADEYNHCVPEQRPLDNGTCTDLDKQAPSNYNWATSTTALRYNNMGAALAKVNRTIQYALCNWGQADVQSWGNSTGASWRATNDIYPQWDRITDIWNQNSFYLHNVDFWGHSDADMLEVGNGALTFEQSRTHFAIWALMKSPLLIGTDLEKLHDSPRGNESIALLKNRYLLAFHQDPVYGKPAMPYKWGSNPNWTFDWLHPAEYWSGRYSKGVIALIHNPDGEKRAPRRFRWVQIPELDDEGTYRVINGWTGEDLGCRKRDVRVNIQPHDSALAVFRDDCGSKFLEREKVIVPTGAGERRWVA